MPSSNSRTVVLSLCISIVFPAYANPPEGEKPDPAISAWYLGLKQPGTAASCCSVADCRPTDLRRDPKDATQWQAFIGKAQFGVLAPDEWVSIPPSAILPQRDNPTGRVVICWYAMEIHCAVLPSLT